MPTVLILDDEASIRGFISLNLRRHGFEAVEAATGEEAVACVERDGQIAIALLDVVLPGIDGIEVCRILRQAHPCMGIIMLTARGMEADRVSGFACGADDYVVKPFSPSELVARVKALYRRVSLSGAPQAVRSVTSGVFTLRPSERAVLKNGLELKLTPREYDILRLLIEKADRSVSRDEILDEVWGVGYVGDPRVVDVNISRLRQKVEDSGAGAARHIERVWGLGYRWRGGDTP